MASHTWHSVTSLNFTFIWRPIFGSLLTSLKFYIAVKLLTISVRLAVIDLAANSAATADSAAATNDAAASDIAAAAIDKTYTLYFY